MDSRDPEKISKYELIFDLIDNELQWAVKNYPKDHSLHEGYAILLEELDELWDEIKLNPKKRIVEKIAKEAIQVSAMAARFLLDLIPTANLVDIAEEQHKRK